MLKISVLDPPSANDIKIFGGPPIVYEGDVITLHCQAGPCYPGNDGPGNFTQRSTLILGINNLQWESGKIQGQENSTEFAYLGISKIVTKASLTFTVTY